MNPLYALRQWRRAHSTGHGLPYVSGLPGHAAVIARADRKKANAQRAQRYAGRIARAGAWLWDHRRQIGERAAIIVGSVAITWLVCAQPAIDQRDHQIATLTEQRDQLSATALRMARGELTINLTGRSNDVQKHVRAIAELEK